MKILAKTFRELEREENGNRTSYTVTEKVALGLTIEAEAKVAAKERERKRKSKDEVTSQNFGESNGDAKPKESAQVAAAAAGFGNAETYRQAKQAVKKGSAALIAAMDEGEKADPPQNFEEGNGRSGSRRILFPKILRNKTGQESAERRYIADRSIDPTHCVGSSANTLWHNGPPGEAPLLQRVTER